MDECLTRVSLLASVEIAIWVSEEFLFQYHFH